MEYIYRIIEFLNFTLLVSGRATEIKYALVHVLLPVLPPPKVAGLGSGDDRFSNFSIIVSEDEKKIVNLKDFVSFEEDPSTLERIPEFQQRTYFNRISQL